MKTTLILLCTALAVLPCCAQPEPAVTPAAAAPVVVQPIVVPVQPMTPERFEASAGEWLGAIQRVGGAALAVLGALTVGFAMLWVRVSGIVSRQDRQAAKSGSMQQQVTALAAAIPPTPEAASMPNGEALARLMEQQAREVIARETKAGGVLAGGGK